MLCIKCVERMCLGGGGGGGRGHVRSTVYSQHIDDGCTIRLTLTSVYRVGRAQEQIHVY